MRLANIDSWIFDEEDCKDICGIVDSVLSLARDVLEWPPQLTLTDSKTIFNRYSQSVLMAENDPEETLEKFRKLGVRLSNAQQIHDFNMRIEGALNYAQRGVLNKIFSGPQRVFHISGGAGTGKTLIGFAAAEKFIKENPEKKVLYVCFNSTLAAFYNVKQISSQLVITSFFRLPHLCFTPTAAREIFKSDMACEDKDWKEVIVPRIQDKWNSTEDRCPGIIPQSLFDLIIIDEAQDFNDKMLEFIFCLKKPEAKIIFLSDKVQSIYEKNPCIEQLESDHLDINLRNTIEIDSFSCVPINLTATADVNGPEVSEISGDWESLHKCLEEMITQFSFSQVAVLSDTQDVLSAIEKIPCCSFCGVDKKFKNTMERLKQWQQDKKIWKSTVHSFKGLEAECVIYVKTDNIVEERLKIDYIGATRAKYQLIVFTLTKN